MKSIILVLLCSFKIYALEYGCSLQPNEIAKRGTAIIEQVYKQKVSFPDNSEILTDLEAEFDSVHGNKVYGTVEAFLRPADDVFFSPSIIPILGLDVSRDRIILYVCGHYEDDPAKTHLTIFFLRAYHIDPPSFGNFWGDLFSKPAMEVRPIPASLLGISEIKKFFLKIFRFIPFSNVYFDTFSILQRALANAVGDVTGFGVERIELTNSYVRVTSGVNLNSPREALYKKTFKLKKPELGPSIGGKDNEPDKPDISSKSFMETSDSKVIKNLNTNKLSYEIVDE